jgi:hypothetical protein
VDQAVQQSVQRACLVGCPPVVELVELEPVHHFCCTGCGAEVAEDPPRCSALYHLKGGLQVLLMRVPDRRCVVKHWTD